MCGIVGAIAQRDVTDILLGGLQRLEYRGYDSAGIALLTEKEETLRERCVGKVKVLSEQVHSLQHKGNIGIAHTRWATHGEPSEANAHPHMSKTEITVVHNGIIENHQQLRHQLQGQGYIFTSATDTEVIAHLVECERAKTSSLLAAVQQAVSQLEGAYGMVVMSKDEPELLVVARSGSPLVLGLGEGENFIASDQFALQGVTQKFIYLDEGDVATVGRDQIQVYDSKARMVERSIQSFNEEIYDTEKVTYNHYMQKEIYEQPEVLKRTLLGRVSDGKTLPSIFGEGSQEIFERIEHIQIVACGTSYNAGLVARYWFESMVGISCDIEIASEFRYRTFVTRPNSLLVTLSQSGETADTLAALRLAKQKGFMSSLTICNVATSSLVRESDLKFMTNVGPEIGVASTKAFTSQLMSLLMLMTSIGNAKKTLDSNQQTKIINALQRLPEDLSLIVSQLDNELKQISKEFIEKNHTLFIGRGSYSAIAAEAALKLKEISYIHAEAYAAGELKHGPLALVDEHMPIVVLAPNNELFDKVMSNIEEVRARGGFLYIFTDAAIELKERMKIIKMPAINDITGPILYTLPMQFLAYYIALVKGTDVDQPRNLAKSVTVE